MRVTVIGSGGVGGYFGARLAQGGCNVGFVARGEQLREVLGEQAVVGGLCYIGSKILRPGVIQHTGTIQKMIFGELDGRPSARTEALLAAGKRGGIEAAISPDIRRAIWEKCVFITGVSAATTAMRSPVGPIRSPDARLSSRPHARSGRRGPRPGRESRGRPGGKQAGVLR